MLGIDINAKQYTTIFKELKQLKQLNTKKGQAKQHGITNMINKFDKHEDMEHNRKNQI